MTPKELPESGEKSGSTDSHKAKPKGFSQPKAGKQPGAKGKWRNQPLKAERIIEHYPQWCAACNASLEEGHGDEKPYMGYYQLELVREKSGLRVECQLHHYYGMTCSCTHHSQAVPLEGELSEVAGRKVQLQLQEYTLVGPMLGSLIASLSVRYRLSRAKIQEFLLDWTDVELSIGSIDRSIREAGLACRPVVEDLIEQLQDARILHLDETPWYKSGHLCWLWVAMSCNSAVFFIGKRTKESLGRIITPEFPGWLVSDGYGAYHGMLLSVIETCRLRGLNPWTYLGEVIATRRKGMSAPLIPQTLPQA